MNKLTVDKMVDIILDMERESIKKRGDIVTTNTIKYGKYKADSEVVNRILLELSERGIKNEN